MTYPQTLYIDGRAETSEILDAVVNPATEAVLARVPRAAPAQVDAAVQAAARAFPAWAEDAAGRRKALLASADVLAAASEEVAALITAEQGRPLAQAKAEVAGAVAILRGYGHAPEPAPQVLRADGERYVAVVRRPLGVVAAIAPWNVPLILLVLKLAPALAAGNTVVAKPSEYTPLSTLRLGQLIGPLFPPGVINVLAGPGAVGEQLVQHPGVRKITFTGSVATGRRVFTGAAGDFKRLTLELGGNDAALVLADADPEAIAEKIFWGAFWNSGQVCFAIKRLYVARPLFQPLLDALLARVARTTVGDGVDPASELGPLTNAAQLVRVEALVEDARARGAVIHSGGARLPRPGYFYPPTLVSGLAADAPLVAEEQFGPVLPILPYDDVDAALAEINANPYGLGASVWTRDEARGRALVQRLDVGLAWVNAHLDLHPGAPKGGQKWSGLGYEGGSLGDDGFVSFQTLNSAPFPGQGGHHA